MNVNYLNKKAFSFLLGAFFFLAGTTTQAQTTDSTGQKPQLNNELPGLPTPAPATTQPAPAPQPVPVTPTPEVQPEPIKEPAPATRSRILKPAEKEEKTSMLDRVFIGGTGGLGFGGDPYYGSYFNASISPIIGYRIFERFAVGPGVTYEYTGSNGYHLSTYGGKLFAQLSVYKGFLLHAEHEILSAADLTYQNNQIVEMRRRITSTLAGGGYRQMYGNFGMDLYVLLNLNNDVYQYRSNPVIRVGFIYNLKRSKD